MDLELKFKNFSWDVLDILITPTLRPTLLTIAEGVGDNQRIGRKIMLRRLQWRFGLTLFGQVGEEFPPTSEVIRVIIYLDRQSNGAQANASLIIDPAEFRALYPLAEQNRIVILKDMRVAMNNQTLAHIPSGDKAGFATCQVNKQFDWDWKCAIPIVYDGAPGLIGDMTSNNIGGLIISQSGQKSLMTGDMRVSYTDE